MVAGNGDVFHLAQNGRVGDRHAEPISEPSPWQGQPPSDKWLIVTGIFFISLRMDGSETGMLNLARGRVSLHRLRSGLSRQRRTAT